MKIREKAASPPRQARTSGLVSKGFPLVLAWRGGLAGTECRLTEWHSDTSPLSIIDRATYRFVTSAHFPTFSDCVSGPLD